MRLDFSRLPAVDVLIAGPPCPPWSVGGQRKGEKDPRAEVFWPGHPGLSLKHLQRQDNVYECL